MPIRFTCSVCHSQLSVPDNLGGLPVRCPWCHLATQVPKVPEAIPVAERIAPTQATSSGVQTTHPKREPAPVVQPIQPRQEATPAVRQVKSSQPTDSPPGSKRSKPGVLQTAWGILCLVLVLVFCSGILRTGRDRNVGKDSIWQLSEDQRRRIYYQLHSAELRARREGNLKFHFDPYDPNDLFIKQEEQFGRMSRGEIEAYKKKYIELSIARGNYVEAKSLEYKEEIAKKHGLTRDQRIEIEVEADQKQWWKP